jgi:hypothetical protein
MNIKPLVFLFFGSFISYGALAAPIIFTDFSNVSALQLNGSAAQSGTALRLTPEAFGQSGTAFLNSAVSLGTNVSFSSAFSFSISTPTFGIGDGDGLGADGITFIIQTNSNTAGGAGGGMGYFGIPNSVAIEFDTFNNGIGAGDPDGNHVGIDLGGSIFSTVTAPVAGRLNDGSVHFAFVDYDGTSNLLEVRLSNTNSRPALALLSLTTNLVTQLGTTNAFVGFGSGTGAGVGNHDILSWEFRDTFSPINPVPESGSLALLGLGFAGLMLSRRNKNCSP